MVLQVSPDKREDMEVTERKRRMIQVMIWCRSHGRFDAPGLSLMIREAYSKSWSFRLSASYSWEDVR